VTRWVKTAEACYKRSSGRRDVGYLTLKICHYVFIASDWGTNPARLSDLPGETGFNVKACLESGLAVMAPQVDAKNLEVYLEVVMCLKVLDSQVVARVELPKVRRKFFHRMFIFSTN
jgi:hypothetical protein